VSVPAPEPESTPPSPNAITRLGFEGGGGKGIVYLGAIEALQGLRILEPDIPPADRQLRGVSGSSAGAITAFLLALGYSSQELAQTLRSPATFNAFYDGPDPNRLRHVNRDRFREGTSVMFGKPGPRTERRPLRRPHREFTQTEQQEFRKAVADFPFSLIPGVMTGAAVAATATAGLAALGGGGVLPERVGGVDLGPYTPESPAFLAAPAALAGVSQLLVWLVKQAPQSQLKTMAEKKPFLKALVDVVTASDSAYESYLYNLLFDRGVFPGFRMREFLRDRLVEKLAKQPGAPDIETLKLRADTMNFADFAQITGTDLVVTGVNLTTARPGIFSAERVLGQPGTPSFPVIDAICISSCFPMAFKPVLVTNCANVDDGFWVDGGLLNNLPIHAFDKTADSPLNNEVLAVRLEDVGPRKPDPNDKAAVERFAKEAKDAALKAAEGFVSTPAFFEILGDQLGGLAGSLFFPQEEGQIRSEAERDQTVSLNTHDLETLEFAPKIERSGPLVRDAFASIFQYFRKVPTSEHTTGLDQLIAKLSVK